MSCFGEASTAGCCPIIVFDGEKAAAAWHAAASDAERSWLDHARFRGTPGESVVIRDRDGAARTLLCVLAPGEEATTFADLSATVPAGDYVIERTSTSFNAQAAAYGWWRGSYGYQRYKAKPPESRVPRLIVSDASQRQRLDALTQASALALDLANAPANDMGPEQLEAAIVATARRFDARVSTCVGEDLLRDDFPLIHAVGRASARAPRLVDLRWGNASDPLLTLVGKGVCFDAGGLNLKTADDMLLMKVDMMGAAQALALAQFVMQRSLAVRLRLLVPAVDNTIAGNAYRPLDVLRARNGTTVEIGDTDAEGRLILADALVAAAEEKPHLVIDFATLTGAVTAALGPEVAAFFTNDEHLSQPFVTAGRDAQDLVWPLPLHAPYRERMTQGVGDLQSSLQTNVARPIIAALLLESFLPPQQSWLHVDFCGWNAVPRPGRAVGAETHGLRAAAALIEQVYRV